MQRTALRAAILHLWWLVTLPSKPRALSEPSLIFVRPMDTKTLVLIAISLIWLLCLVVCFLKGKYGMAIVGLVAAVAQEVG
jgi:hypothetical protein